MTEHKRAVYFATENRNKYREAARIAASFGVVMKHLNLEKKEIQSEKLTDITPTQPSTPQNRHAES